MWARRKARRALAQAAYQWQVNETAVLQLRREFGEKALDKADAEFFADVLTLMVNHVAELMINWLRCWIAPGNISMWSNAVFCGWLRRS